MVTVQVGGVGQSSALPVERASGPEILFRYTTEPEALATGRPEVCPTLPSNNVVDRWDRGSCMVGD